MTSLPSRPLEALADLQHRLANRLSELRRRVRWHLAVEGVAKLVAAAAGVLLVSFLLDWWLEPARWARAIVLALELAGLGVLAYRELVLPLRFRLSDLELTSALDRRHPGKLALTPRVASVLQLPSLLDREDDRPSPAMIEHAVRRSWTDLDGIDWAGRLDASHLIKWLAVLALAIILPLAVILPLHATFGTFAKRWLALSGVLYPRNTAVEVLDAADGVLMVPRGEPFTLRARVRDEASPFTRTAFADLELNDGTDIASPLQMFEPSEAGRAGDFRLDAAPLQHPATLWVRAGDAQTEAIQLIPQDRPRLAELSVTATHPALKEPIEHSFTRGEGELSLLPKSRVTLTVRGSVLLADVQLAQGSGTPAQPERVDEQTYRLTWVHEEPVQLRLELVSAGRAPLRSHPYPVAIGLRRDSPPRVTLQHRGVRPRITPQATIPFTASARDDFGVASMHLVLNAQRLDARERERFQAAEQEALAPPEPDQPEAPEAEAKPAPEPEARPGAAALAAVSAPPDAAPPEPESFAPVPLFGPTTPASQPFVEQTHTLDVQPLMLLPGDVLRVTAQATDERFLGAQTGVSRDDVFRIVSADDLFRDILTRQQGLRAQFRKARADADELLQDLRIARMPDRADEMLRRFRLIQRSVWSVHRGLEDSAVEMDLNRLAGGEASALMRRKILTPMTTLHDATMTVQRQSMENLTAPGGGEAVDIDDLITRQGLIVEEMDRILKAMAQWDSFIDVLNQLDEVIGLQTKARQKTENLQREQVENIFDD